MFKLSLEMQRYQRSNCLHLLDHRESKRIPGGKKKKKNLTSVSLTMLKPLTVWIITKCYVKEKTVKNMGKPDCLTCLLRNLYGGQEATD